MTCINDSDTISALDAQEAQSTSPADLVSIHDHPTFTECTDRLPPEDAATDDGTWYGQRRTAIMAAANRIPIEMERAVGTPFDWRRLDLFAEFAGGDHPHRPARFGGVGAVVG